MNERELKDRLRSLRQQALADGPDKLGAHQLDAHWSMAYACGEAPEPWEIYRVPALNGLPSTDFYIGHAAEVQQALQANATWELLQEHAVPRLALAAEITKPGGYRPASQWSQNYPGKVQFYDAENSGVPIVGANWEGVTPTDVPAIAKGLLPWRDYLLEVRVATTKWVSIDVPAVRWFDARETLREVLLETKAELQAKVAEQLARYEKAAAKDPRPKRLEALAGYQRFVRELLPERLRRFDAEKADLLWWLSKLDQTPDFLKTLFVLLRRAENEVRQSHGIAAVGEAWVSETELLYRVRKLLPDVAVVAHGRPKWLGRQHLDIWMPTLSVAIEYHGPQHFRPVEFFGGAEAFERVRERDDRKRRLCERSSIRLIEIAYDNEIDDANLKELIIGAH